ncbi:MAG: hypothetical protein K5872_06310 [Rhizobiaceae bacterium]|nr:hypothetical protein [Rhizobiaceae bacterium]MCV0405827.1 hypothetical protein [Rhizobiaceae bacterium]
MKIGPIVIASGASLLVAVTTVPTALAGERPHARDLPGVEEGHRIVDEDARGLPPEPEPDRLPGAPGTYRVGDWDVTISGSVSFEIGTGPITNGR